MNTKAKIIKLMNEELLFEEIFNEENSGVTFNDLNVDCLDLVEMVMTLEECFSIEIPDEDAENFKCLDDMVAYVGKHL